jgi:hypothetical protein
MAVRGFHVKTLESRDLLETVGRSFLTGYGYAAQARTAAGAEQDLETVARQFRGFSYEGAAMGFAVREGLPIPARGLVEELLRGRGADHVYMVYVGVGWAMARLPRFRWTTLHAPDPLLRWLVLDGYGFHQAYFKTRRYVQECYQEQDFPWPGDISRRYASNAIDQGIGRALWFVGGTDPEVVVALIERFPVQRHPDLYSGAGLAATYAGGGDESELRAFWGLAGQHRPYVAQGAAFAATARVQADLVMPHNELATRIFCGTTPDEALKISAEALVDLPPDGEVPAYEVWRQRIAAAFETSGHC